MSKSGELKVERDGKRLVLDFPSLPAGAVSRADELAGALGAAPEEILKGRDYFVILASQKEVAGITPDIRV